MDDAARIRDIYDAFNARDIDAVLATMTDDVDYWTRQWAAIDPSVEAVGVAVRPDGAVAVDVEQVVRDLDGTVVAQGRVVHVYTLRDGLVARMDIVEGGEGRS